MCFVANLNWRGSKWSQETLIPLISDRKQRISVINDYLDSQDVSDPSAQILTARSAVCAFHEEVADRVRNALNVLANSEPSATYQEKKELVRKLMQQLEGLHLMIRYPDSLCPAILSCRNDVDGVGEFLMHAIHPSGEIGNMLQTQILPQLDFMPAIPACQEFVTSPPISQESLYVRPIEPTIQQGKYDIKSRARWADKTRMNQASDDKRSDDMENTETVSGGKALADYVASQVPPDKRGGLTESRAIIDHAIKEQIQDVESSQKASKASKGIGQTDSGKTNQR